MIVSVQCTGRTPGSLAGGPCTAIHEQPELTSAIDITIPTADLMT